jgi:hypothetical protein
VKERPASEASKADVAMGIDYSRAQAKLKQYPSNPPRGCAPCAFHRSRRNIPMQSLLLLARFFAISGPQDRDAPTSKMNHLKTVHTDALEIAFEEGHVTETLHWRMGLS